MHALVCSLSVLLLEASAGPPRLPATFHLPAITAKRASLPGGGKGLWLAPVPSLKRSVIQCYDTRRKRFRICDLDPQRKRLRVLWTAPRKGHFRLLGQRKGAVVVLERGWVKQPGGGMRAAPKARLHILAPGRRPVTRSLQLGKLRIGGAPDAIRGDRILLVGPSKPGRPQIYRKLHGPFSAPVWLHHLSTGKRRLLGRAQGGWTRCTGGIHPHLYVVWSDGAPRYRHVSCYPGITLVDPKNPRLAPPLQWRAPASGRPPASHSPRP